MTNKRNAQTYQQQKSEKPKASGILQRAAVRPVSDAGMQSTEENEELALSNSAFYKDFSQVPISTTKPQQIMAKQMLSPVVQQKNTPASVQSGEVEASQQQEMSEVSSEGIGASGVQKENKTGLPDKLKAGIENLSGLAMDDVRVHYNSSKPAEVQALAYAQGTDIHVAPGQEKHLPHEAWHIVQQKQGRVKPTLQAKGVAINDDEGLEREADLMGVRAVHQPVKHLRENLESNAETYKYTQLKSNNELKQIVQCKWDHLFNDIPKTLHNLPDTLKKSRIETIRKQLNTIRDNPTYGVDNLHSGTDRNSEEYGHSQQSFLTAVKSYNQGLLNERGVREATHILWKYSVDRDALGRLGNKARETVQKWNSYEKETWDALTAHSPALDR